MCNRGGFHTVKVVFTWKSWESSGQTWLYCGSSSFGLSGSGHLRSFFTSVSKSSSLEKQVHNNNIAVYYIIWTHDVCCFNQTLSHRNEALMDHGGRFNSNLDSRLKWFIIFIYSSSSHRFRVNRDKEETERRPLTSRHWRTDFARMIQFRSTRATDVGGNLEMDGWIGCLVDWLVDWLID